MILEFRKPRRACGYALQMVIDTEAKTARVGYCLTIHHCKELKAKDFDEMLDKLRFAGFVVERG